MRRNYLLYLTAVIAVAAGLMVGPRAGMAFTYKQFLLDNYSGNLNQPSRISFQTGDNPNGVAYITDAGNKKVKKYVNGDYDPTFSLNVAGTPVGIAANDTNIFVGDDTNDCVWVYDTNGNLADLGATGGTHKLGGVTNTTVKMPSSIAISPGGHIFVTDGDNDKILIYNASGSYNSEFGQSGSAVSSGTTIYTYFPSGITMAESSVVSTTATQYFWIGDQGNNRVQKLYYKYNTLTHLITTVPTCSAVKGSKGDTFGQYLRVSDLAYQKSLSRLYVVDSLQMVVQILDNNGNNIGTGEALNYTTSVDGHLNVPTGIAISNAIGTLPYGKAIVVSNQDDKYSAFYIGNGNPPAITAIDPATNITPTTTPYTVNYTITDSDSASVDINVYYYEVGTPESKTLIGSDTVAMSGGTGSSSLDWDWSLIPAGDYVVYGVATDSTGNFDFANSTGMLSVQSGYDGCSNYTNGLFAIYGAAASDFDGDGLSNCDELNGTNHTDVGNTYTSEMGMADTDLDGLNDGQEDNAIILYGSSCYLDPRDTDTDNGGISDYVETQNGTDPCDGGTDDMGPTPQTIGGAVNIGDPSYIYDSYLEMMNTSPTVTVIGDLIFRRAVDGSVIDTLKAVTFPPLGSKSIRIQDYTSEANVAVDFQSYGAKYITGTITCYLINHYDNESIDGDYMIPMDMGGGAADLWTGFLNCNVGRYYTWMTVRNPSFTSSVDARIIWYTNAGVLALQKDYTIPAGSSIILNPVDEGLTPSQYYANIQGLSGNVSGYYVHFRYTTSDPTLNAYAFGVAYEDTMASEMVLDNFNDDVNNNGYKAWFSLTNPTFANVSALVTYYNTDGSEAMSVTKVVPARKYLVWSPQQHDGNAGGSYSAKIVTTKGEQIGGYFIMFRRDVVTLAEAFDQASVFQKDMTKSEYYVPYWNESTTSYSQHLPVTWLVLRNPSTSSSINVTIQTYATDGTPNASKTVPVGPNGKVAQRMRTANFAGLSIEEGSCKLTATGPFTGWIWRFTRNPYDGVSNDSGGGNAMLPTP